MKTYAVKSDNGKYFGGNVFVVADLLYAWFVNNIEIAVVLKDMMNKRFSSYGKWEIVDVEIKEC